MIPYEQKSNEMKKKKKLLIFSLGLKNDNVNEREFNFFRFFKKNKKLETIMQERYNVSYEKNVCGESGKK